MFKYLPKQLYLNKLLTLTLTLISFCTICTAQTCNNWLYNPIVGSSISIGDLDVPGNQITVEATINRTVAYVPGVQQNSEGDVVSKHNGPTDINYLLRPNHAYITTSNGFFATPDVCEIKLNKTYHLAMVYDGSTLKYYRNGFLLSQITATGNLIQNNWKTRFGLYDASYWETQFLGYINEVKIWNTARTQAQIRVNMNTSLQTPTTEAGLVAYYTFDNLINKQGNSAYDGQLIGNAAINQTNTNCLLVLDSCSQKVITAGIGNIINSYTPIVQLDVCSNKITVEDASTFNTGDTILMMQMKGAIIDSSNSPTFGTISKYNNTGNYEFNYIKSKSGNVIELLDSITRAYDVPFGKVQLIRVPYFKTANINTMLTCLPWDGNKGGVLVLNARDSVNLQANIDVSGRGFSGGKSLNTGATKLMCFENQYVYPAGSIIAAAKGEGVAIINDNIGWGKGSPANAGGGGIGHNSGGGGGSNGGAGGLGGYQLEACGNAPFDNRGIGGKGLSYDNTQNKVFLGGGGGSGHTDNAGGSDMNGGNGGGIIIINTNSIQSNGFNIIAKGGDAPQCSNILNNCHDGSGGGGGGGSVLINNTNYIDSLLINCTGGKGADLVIFNNINAGRIGPGGGGGAGVAWLNNSTLPTKLKTALTGGVNGVIILDNNNPWGATSGIDGVNLFNLQIPIDTKPFKKNIDSTKIKVTTLSCSTAKFSGISYINKYPITNWLWNFGDNTTDTVQNNIHVFKKAGTFKISLIVTDSNGCSDSIITSFTTLGGGADDFSYKQDICNPLTVQFFSLNNNPINLSWYFDDNSSVKSVVNPIHSYSKPGNYLIKYITQNGSCTDTITKNITISFTKENILLTKDTTLCYGTSKQLLTAPSLLDFCWSPTDYLSDAGSANPITNTRVPITYFLTAAVAGKNIITNGDFSAGNTGFTAQYTYANPNTTEGQYFVGPSDQVWNTSMSNCSDHTTGTGNMLIVNGASVADVGVWNQNVTVLPNTNYAFSTWIESLYPPNPAQLNFSINGKNIGSTITASSTNCKWIQFYTTWNSGANVTAAISIVNKNTEVQGNDFALDDISFAAVEIKKDSIVISIDKVLIKANNDTSICVGKSLQLSATGATTYKWSPSTGLDNAEINNPVATPVSTTQYIIAGTNLKGCTAYDTLKITTIALPVVNRTSDTLICKNLGAQLWASGGDKYRWSPATSLNNSSIANPVARPTKNTVYYIIVTGTGNCEVKDSVHVSLRPEAIFSVSVPDTTCLNTSVQLSASGGDTYLWSPAKMVSNAGIANPMSTANTDAAYSVNIKENACNTSITLFTSLKVLPVPVITITKSNDISCVNNTTSLYASGASTYTWLPANKLNNNSIANPIATPEITTEYKVIGIDNITKCSATSNITVFVTKDGDPKFFIPNAFSPNNDGKNDCFKVTHFNYLKSVEVSIYNRSGNLVFHTTNDTDCWDGFYKGGPAEIGNYIYYIKTENNCGFYFQKGNLILIR